MTDYDWHVDWRKQPARLSAFSVVLLVIFVGAAAFLGYMAWERPWAGSTAGHGIDAQRLADLGLGRPSFETTVTGAPEAAQVAPAAQAAPAGP
ncbi:MAG TPA: hypothetical protein VLS25_13410 [Dehalococcoidia bacterium]|nr:hypothetical protein [Dehalococcoidia bacterium]